MNRLPTPDLLPVDKPAQGQTVFEYLSATAGQGGALTPMLIHRIHLIFGEVERRTELDVTIVECVA